MAEDNKFEESSFDENDIVVVSDVSDGENQQEAQQVQEPQEDARDTLIRLVKEEERKDQDYQEHVKSIVARLHEELREHAQAQKDQQDKTVINIDDISSEPDTETSSEANSVESFDEFFLLEFPTFPYYYVPPCVVGVFSWLGNRANDISNGLAAIGQGINAVGNRMNDACLTIDNFLDDTARGFSQSPQPKTQDQLMAEKLQNIAFGFNHPVNPTPIPKRLQALQLDPTVVTVDLRKDFIKVYDQGHIGSCTAQAIAGAYNYHVNKMTNKLFFPSRLFIYYDERYIEHTVNTDSGASIQDGMQSLQIYGACDESMWPYNVSKFKVKPPRSCYANARDHKTHDPKPVDTTPESFKAQLQNGMPVVFGFKVYESFMTMTTAKTGIMSMPISGEKLLGGHAVVAVGYNDNMTANGQTGFFIIRNSWGLDWGQQGHFYMPYAYVTTNDDQCADSWVFEEIA
jgi:C1A family cysteine protease